MKIFKKTRTNCAANTLSLFWGLRKIKFGNLGGNVRLSGNGFFGNAHNIFIGDDVFIAQEVYIDAMSKITIGSGSMIGPKCTFMSGTHNYNSSDLQAIPYDNKMKNKPIEVERNVWIGANVTVSPGTHIGEGSIIGAGACVYGKIPAFSVVVSSGYRIIDSRNVKQYNSLLEQNAIYGKLFAGKGFEHVE